MREKSGVGSLFAKERYITEFPASTVAESWADKSPLIGL